MAIYLGFHGLGTPNEQVLDSERPYWVPVDRFREILGAVATSSREVGLTFDDGNKSDIEQALPALLQHGLVATFFAVSERIGASNYLCADDIRALDRAGMRVGSHGARHIRLTELTDDVMTRQVGDSISALSEILGKRVDCIALPFGAYDRRVLQVLRRLRLARVYTSDFGPVVPKSWIVARNTVKLDTPLTEINALLDKRYSAIDIFRARLRQWNRSLRRWN
jgi:peptidoglycan/xylan/chitin deacetylase (PgdA/CDA1 family)